MLGLLVHVFPPLPYVLCFRVSVRQSFLSPSILFINRSKTTFRYNNLAIFFVHQQNLFLPGLVTPEPDTTLLDSTMTPVEACQRCSSPSSQMISRNQSRVETLACVGASVPRPPTPRTNKTRLIMVKPFKGGKTKFCVREHPG